MASKDNFISLKEVYEKILGAKRKPQSISYKGEVFYHYGRGKRYMKVYPDRDDHGLSVSRGNGTTT